MTTAIQFNWNVFCTTEGCFRQWVQKWRPTTCPVDATHEIDQTQTFYTTSDAIPNLLDQSIHFGYYSCIGVSFTATANSTTTHLLTFPYDITILGSNMLIEDENKGDLLTINLNPDTVVGALILDANIGDTAIYPDITTIEYAVKGTYMTINGDTDNVYVVQNVDVMNSAVLLTTPLANNYSAGSYVSITIWIIRDFILPSKQNVLIGNFNPTSTVIEANWEFYFIYVNYGDTDKTFNFFMQYY